MRRFILEREIPKVGLPEWAALPPWLGSFVDAVARRARDAGDTLALWRQRRRQRRRLTSVSDHMLSDMGLSRSDVAVESEKPFWRK